LLDAPLQPAFSARYRFPASAQFPAAGVFREGAENSARGGRAPFSISEFGKSLAVFFPFFRTSDFSPLSVASDKIKNADRIASVCTAASFGAMFALP
jgi:hypothetical protein